MRDKVLCIGSTFSLKNSADSRRRPSLFDWTAKPEEATVDTTVCIQNGIIRAVDYPGRKIGWLCDSHATTRGQYVRAIIRSNLDRYMDAYEVILTSGRADCELHPGFVYHPAGVVTLGDNFEIVKYMESADDLLYRNYIRPGVTGSLPGTSRVFRPEPATSSKRQAVNLGDAPPAGQHTGLVDLPFEPWDPAPIQQLVLPEPVSAETYLCWVTEKDKVSIKSLADVPPQWLSTREIKTMMRRPKSIYRRVEEMEWLPQLKKAFLIHLPGGFIGDNVVFDNERYYAFGRWWMGSDWRLYSETQSVLHIDAGISIGAWGGESFQHFIMDALPTLAGVIDLLESPGFEHVKIISHHKGAGVAQWFWRKLGLESRIVQKPLNAKEGFVVHADLVLYSQYMPSLGEIGLYPRHLLRPLQRRLGLLEPIQHDRVIYLQRPSDFPRTVANESELLSRIKKELIGTGLDLEVFEGPMLEVQDDMERFRRARIIFGPHGGALANMIFAQPGTHVIEFLPIYRLYPGGRDSIALTEGRESRTMFWGLAQAAGLDYWTVEPENFAYEEPEGMLVDVDEVAAIFRCVLDSDGVS